MNIDERYPKIWKTESCLEGECLEKRIQHWWSIPFTTPMGLMCECYHCRKTKIINIEKNAK